MHVVPRTILKTLLSVGVIYYVILPIALFILLFVMFLLPGVVTSWKVKYSGINNMQIIKFPKSVGYQVSSSELIEDSNNFASLYLDNGLGIYIDKISGYVRFDDLNGTSLHNDAPLDVLDCYSDKKYCVIVQSSYENKLFATQIVKYNYTEGSTTKLYQNPPGVRPIILHIPDFIGILEAKEGLVTEQFLINAKTLALLRNPASEERQAAGFDSDAFNKPYPIELNEIANTRRSQTVESYLSQQPVTVERQVITQSNYFGTPYDIDFRLKIGEKSILTFKTMDETLRPLGYFGNRYYFTGRTSSPKEFSGYLGYFNLENLTRHQKQ